MGQRGCLSQRTLEKSFMLNKNENTTYQNSWDGVIKAAIQKPTASNTYITTKESSQINHLSFHHKKVEKGRTNWT